MKVRLWVFLLLVGIGKALRYISVVYLEAWASA
jgi:membrane protein YqaA with SNARE-associated domain